MIRVTVSPTDPDDGALLPAAESLRQGGLVAFPTETVYGLGACALDVVAVRRIFEAKGRPATNPLIVHVAMLEQARALAATWPPLAERLARALWPGPLTLVVPRGESVPREVTAGLDAVGLRVPAHPVALALLRLAAVPVAAPSANRYTRLSPTTADHVALGLADHVDVLVDAGPCVVGIESTVLDLTGAVPRVLRPGGLSVARIREIVGDVEVLAGAGAEGELPSPGLARRHYAPRARVVVLEASALAGAAVTGAAVISRSPIEGLPPGVHSVVLPPGAEGFGARLYATLHRLDAAGVPLVLVEAPPPGDDWLAVQDRLCRAAEGIAGPSGHGTPTPE